MARKENGGTTVAATMIASHMAGIKVFSTGGIGGVHRNAPMDVSADLIELGRTPLIVVCSGAKAILDLPFTMEVLETQGVPVVGYQTDELPGFYSTSSGLPVNVRIERPEEAAEIARAQWDAGLANAVLVVVPPPAEVAVPREKIESSHSTGGPGSRSEEYSWIESNTIPAGAGQPVEWWREHGSQPGTLTQ